jgi:hypothetical protein
MQIKVTPFFNFFQVRMIARMPELDITTEAGRNRDFKLACRVRINSVILIGRVDLHMCNPFCPMGISDYPPNGFGPALREKAEGHEKAKA